ncbi:hypothetical protein MKEN_00997200 [Mycena kentingensis (nom. inval.)]|nr:hypothetical protein MKEN_00997200 [Mycena kentingensis (nom. inval.)]
MARTKTRLSAHSSQAPTQPNSASLRAMARLLYKEFKTKGATCRLVAQELGTTIDTVYNIVSRRRGQSARDNPDNDERVADQADLEAHRANMRKLLEGRKEGRAGVRFAPSPPLTDSDSEREPEQEVVEDRNFLDELLVYDGITRGSGEYTICTDACLARGLTSDRIELLLKNPDLDSGRTFLRRIFEDVLRSNNKFGLSEEKFKIAQFYGLISAFEAFHRDENTEMEE